MQKVIELTTEKKIKNADVTKKNIFQAATKLFSKRNYDEVRVSDIAKIAGIDAALIIRYFKSKENLYAEIIKNAFIDDINQFIENWPSNEVGKYIAKILIESKSSKNNMEEIMELMYRSSSNEVTSKLVYENIHIPVKKLIAEKIMGENAELKASLIIAYLNGISGLKRFPDEQIFKRKNKNTFIELLSFAIDKCL